MPEYILVHTEEEYSIAANLFREYAAWLDIDLGFQHFEEELKELKKMYSAPGGGILLCKVGTEYIACVAVRKIGNDIAELKRMFVRETHRFKGIGGQLLERSIALAVKLGYTSIRLDTLNHMHSAIGLYKKYEFREIEPYYHNPIATAVYFELKIPG